MFWVSKASCWRTSGNLLFFTFNFVFLFDYIVYSLIKRLYM